MKIIRNIILSILLFFSTHSYSNDFQPKQSYLELKNMLENNNSNRSEVFEYIKSLPIDILYKVGELSSEDIKSSELSIVNLEVRRRIKSDLNKSYLIDQISTDDFEPNYAFFLFSNLYNNQKYYENEELTSTIDILRKTIVNYTDKKYEQKLSAIIASNKVLGRFQAEKSANENEIIIHSNLLQNIALDNNENSEIRRVAIKGLQQLNSRESIENLKSIFLNPNILTDAPLARSLCIAMGHFKEQSAIPHIENILKNTQDEYIYASAAISLGDIGGEKALQILVDSNARFRDDYCGVAIRKMRPLIQEILLNKTENMLYTAVKATKLFYEGYKTNPKENIDILDEKDFDIILKKLLFKTSDKHLIRLILDDLTQKVDKKEAKEIIRKIKYDKIYEMEWDFIENISRSRPANLFTSNLTIGNETKGNLNYQEYGDTGYKDLDWSLVGHVGHTGIFSGINYYNSKRFYEMLNDSPSMHENYWSDMISDPDNVYWGAYTLNNIDMTFSRRRMVVDVANTVFAYDIGYPWLGSDLLNHYNNPGTYVGANEIEELRCDGLVEYCYEWNDLYVWGKNGTNYDVSVTNNVEDHNDLYVNSITDDPDYELAPIVQSGRAGGTSTHMTSSAIVDTPTYSGGYTQNGSNIILTITANDKSGIHYIRYKVGMAGSYVSSPVQPQHPTSSSYTYQFTIPMSSSGNIYFYAKDNGGNYPKDDPYVYIDISLIPETPSLVEPNNMTEITDSTPSFSWATTSNTTGYELIIDNNSDFMSPEINTTISTNSYTPTNSLTEGVSYWKVRSINTHGCSDYSSPWAFRIVLNLPETPSLVEPSNMTEIANSTPNFSWSKTNYTNAYEILVDNNSDFLSPEINITITTNDFTPTSDLAEDVFYWKVRSENGDGYSDYSDPWAFRIIADSVSIDNTNLPIITKLYQNYPNPFNPETTISFDIDKKSMISLIIYNSNGEVVRNLFNGIKNEGNHSELWNCKNNNGNIVNSGIYIIELKTDNYSEIIKSLMIK